MSSGDFRLYRLPGVRVCEKTLEALNPYLGSSTYFGTEFILVLTIIVLLGICYLVGALVSTQIGALTFDNFQRKLGDIIPGYEIATNLLRGIARKEMSYPPALVTLAAPRHCRTGLRHGR